MMKLYTNPRYNELETREADYNDYLEDNEIRQEIIDHEYNMFMEEREFEDIIQNEPQ